MGAESRPISPHLTIYRPQIIAFASILHRAMNTLLLGGAFVLAIWVVAVAAGGGFFEFFAWLWRSPIGKLALFAWTFAGFFYVLQWIHHFIWDLGYGFELEQARLGAWLVVILSVVATVSCWTWLVWM